MIAIIAGTGNLPLEACKNLRAKGQPFFVVSLFPENNASELAAVTHGIADVVAQEFYKPGDVLSLLKKRLATHVLFIGKVDKNNLLKHLKFDWLAIKLMGSVLRRSDKDIMEALLAELARNNIQTLRQDDVLGGLLVPPGILTGTLMPELENDILVGLEAAQAIAHADIGQTVVVKDGMILAVEAIEGTDACIKRGLEIGKEKVVICKTARTDQNKKFDLPTLGPGSLAGFQPGQVAVIAWHAPCTLIAQKDIFVERAEKLGIVLVARPAITYTK